MAQEKNEKWTRTIEFTEEQQNELAKSLNVEINAVKNRISALHELNPMLGHRGCRLGIAYPEITEMQVTAILEATAELTQAGKPVLPEIMIPLVSAKREVELVRARDPR